MHCVRDRCHHHRAAPGDASRCLCPGLSTRTSAPLPEGQQISTSGVDASVASVCLAWRAESHRACPSRTARRRRERLATPHRPAASLPARFSTGRPALADCRRKRRRVGQGPSSTRTHAHELLRLKRCRPRGLPGQPCRGRVRHRTGRVVPGSLAFVRIPPPRRPDLREIRSRV
jgi:hypothetical protein